MCTSGAMETIEHFLLVCPALASVRQQHSPRLWPLLTIDNKTHTREDALRFLLCTTPQNAQVTSHVGAYIADIWAARLQILGPSERNHAAHLHYS